MPQMNPAVLAWARRTAGLTREEAARKLQIGAARGVGPAARLARMEGGVDQPTRPVLSRMAKHYRRPLIALYLDEPPRPSPVGTDFRTLSGVDPKQDALAQALVRDVIARQGIVRAQLEDEDAAEIGWIGTITMADGRNHALEALRPVVGGAGRKRDFGELRESAEKAGVWILLQGDLGSYHSALDTAAFRGFALADRLAPFIVINSNDERTAWSFTLLHELARLLLGHTGISAAAAESDAARFCNAVASEFLLPASVVERFPASGLRKDRFAPRKKRGAGERGTNSWASRRNRIGKPLLDLARRGIGEGALSTTRAALMLGVKPTQVAQMLETPGSS